LRGEKWTVYMLGECEGARFEGGYEDWETVAEVRLGPRLGKDCWPIFLGLEYSNGRKVAAQWETSPP